MTDPQNNTPPITGIDFNEVRTGEDTRQRGWFWHWNELHTEYGPLLQHSGIGLITSYIVWTDRREHSPYRGYAFPSLQTQASFSGSDRAELMTINRILVALDLIEIRKEMVLRVDEQGHKWRVPHNLYRVKDRSGDPHLTSQDVQAVLQIAAARKDVYRHIRHILTTGFAPIARNNVWHRILEELRPTPLWHQLAAQAEEEEARFSARSRAGHAARKPTSDDIDSGAVGDRKGPGNSPIELDTDIYVPGVDDGDLTATGVTGANGQTLSVTSVAPSNPGLPTLLAQCNEGFIESGPSMVGGSTEAQATFVAPSNPTYYQLEQTTKRRGSGPKDNPASSDSVTRESGFVTEIVTGSTPDLSQVGSGPGLAPESGPDRAAALVAFAEANSRTASVAEERLLTRIVDELAGERGWALVTAAIYEAVDSGSVFVAPKRVREIVGRWMREGRPGNVDTGEDLPNPLVAGFMAPQRDATESSTRGPFWIGEAGLGSGQLWAAVIDLLEQSGRIRPAEVHDYLKPAVLIDRTGIRSFRLGAVHELARRRIERSWLVDIEDALGRLLGGSGWEIQVVTTSSVLSLQSPAS